MLALAITVFAALISVVNPFGALPVFLSLTPSYTAQERNKTAIHTSFYYVLILMSFFLAGSAILAFFGISLEAIQEAGGIIIFSSGMSLLTGKFAQSKAIDKKVKQEALHREDISFTPLAMPMLSGPGSISLLIGMYHQYELTVEGLTIALVILLTGLVIYIMLRTSPALFRLLGEAGLKAISRIIGFLVMAIGIQLIANGVKVLLPLGG